MVLLAVRAARRSSDYSSLVLSVSRLGTGFSFRSLLCSFGSPQGKPGALLRGAVGNPHLQRPPAPSAGPSLRPRHRFPPRSLAHAIIAYGVLLYPAHQQNLFNA